MAGKTTQPTQTDTTNITAGNNMTDSPLNPEASSEASPVAAPLTPLTPYHSETPVYATIAETLDTTSRKTGLTAEAVAAIMATLAAKGAGSIPLAIAGHNGAPTAADFDPETLSEPGEGGYVVSTIGKRGIECADGKTRNGFVALAVYPHHTVSAIVAHTGGELDKCDYLTRLVDKEMGLAAFRNLRFEDGEGLADLAIAAATMPATLDRFLVASREGGGGGAYAVFNDNWAAFRLVLSKSKATKGIVKALPAKSDMLKAIRSSAFAESVAPGLEAKGYIVAIAKLMAQRIEAVNEAAKEGETLGDPAAILDWTEGRDSLDLRDPDAGDVGEIDFGSVKF